MAAAMLNERPALCLKLSVQQPPSPADSDRKASLKSEDSDCSSIADADTVSLNRWDKDEGAFDLEENSELEDDVESCLEYRNDDESITPVPMSLPEKHEALMDKPLEVIASLASVFSHLASYGSQTNSQLSTPFHAAKEPQISIHDYLMRMVRGFGCSEACLVLALVYLDRLVKQNFLVCQLSIHRLLLTSMVVSAKFHDDVYFTMSHYAMVGGIRASELMELETEFASLLQWRLFVPEREYDEYLDLLNMWRTK